MTIGFSVWEPMASGGGSDELANWYDGFFPAATGTNASLRSPFAPQIPLWLPGPGDPQTLDPALEFLPHHSEIQSPLEPALSGVTDANENDGFYEIFSGKS